MNGSKPVKGQNVRPKKKSNNCKYFAKDQLIKRILQSDQTVLLR